MCFHKIPVLSKNTHICRPPWPQKPTDQKGRRTSETMNFSTPESTNGWRAQSHHAKWKEKVTPKSNMAHKNGINSLDF